MKYIKRSLAVLILFLLITEAPRFVDHFLGFKHGFTFFQDVVMSMMVIAAAVVVFLFLYLVAAVVIMLFN